MSIALHLAAKNIHLRIADDGVGFNPDEKPKGIGFRNIESRAAFFSGTMEIAAAVGKGCVLEVAIPAEGYDSTVL